MRVGILVAVLIASHIFSFHCAAAAENRNHHHNNHKESLSSKSVDKKVEPKDVLYSGNQRDPKYVLVAVHGLGDSAENLRTMADMFITSQFPSVLFVFPEAPMQHVTFKRKKMRAWYDIYGTSENSQEDGAGIWRSANRIKMISREISKRFNVPLKNIVIGGFSQGGVVSLVAGLTVSVVDEEKAASSGKLTINGSEGYGGIIVLSGYFGGTGFLEEKKQQFMKKNSENHHSNSNTFYHTTTPILMCHGTDDTTVPFRYAQKSRVKLVDDIGVTRLRFKKYPNLAHTVDIMEMLDVAQWLRDVLGIKEEGVIGGKRQDKRSISRRGMYSKNVPEEPEEL